jgi:hypothetical protein
VTTSHVEELIESKSTTQDHARIGHCLYHLVEWKMPLCEFVCQVRNARKRAGGMNV